MCDVGLLVQRRQWRNRLVPPHFIGAWLGAYATQCNAFEEKTWAKRLHYVSVESYEEVRKALIKGQILFSWMFMSTKDTLEPYFEAMRGNY